MTSLAERFKQARLHKNLSQDELADIASSSQLMLSKIERGLTLQPRNIEYFAKILDVQPEFLMFGANPPSWYNSDKKNTALGIDHYLVKYFHWFKFVSIVDSFNDELNLLYQSLDKNCETIFCPEKTAQPETIALQLSGDSMRSTSNLSFPSGTIIFVELKDYAEVGDFVVAKEKDGITFKQLSLNEFNQKFLKPLNEQYPISYNEFEILGVVISSYQQIQRTLELNDTLVVE